MRWTDQRPADVGLWWWAPAYADTDQAVLVRIRRVTEAWPDGTARLECQAVEQPPWPYGLPHAWAPLGHVSGGVWSSEPVPRPAEGEDLPCASPSS